MREAGGHKLVASRTINPKAPGLVLDVAHLRPFDSPTRLETCLRSEEERDEGNGQRRADDEGTIEAQIEHGRTPGAR